MKNIFTYKNKIKNKTKKNKKHCKKSISMKLIGGKLCNIKTIRYNTINIIYNSYTII